MSRLRRGRVTSDIQNEAAAGLRSHVPESACRWAIRARSAILLLGRIVSSDLLALLAPPLQTQWAALSSSEQIRLLQQHRLLPLALDHLRQAGQSLTPLFAGMLESLESVGQCHARLDNDLLLRVLPALTACRCRPLLLKGVSLGRWLYAAPALRPSTDIDLLVDPQQRLQAHDALIEAGLESDGYSQHDQASQQATYHDPHTGRHIDLHWAINVLPEIACRFDFARLHARSIDVPTVPGARALCRIDALMHAVAHFFAHQPANERPGVWLYDIALLARGLDSAGWAQLDAAVREAGLAGLHVAALRQTSQWFAIELPEAMLETWQALGQGECASHLLHAQDRPIRRLLHSLGCVPSMRGRIAYLRARLFPAVAWMRGRYRTQGNVQLLKAYLRRWTSGLRQTLDAHS